MIRRFQTSGPLALRHSHLTRDLQFLYHPASTVDLARGLAMVNVPESRVNEAGLLGSTRFGGVTPTTVSGSGLAPAAELTVMAFGSAISAFNNDSGVAYLQASEFCRPIIQDSFGGGITLASRLYAWPDFTGSSDVFGPSSGSVGTMRAGNKHVVFTRYLRNTFHDLFVDGAVVSTNSNPGDLVININGPFGIASGQQRTMCTHMVALWTRVLTEGEMEEITRNPWTLLRTSRRTFLGFSVSSVTVFRPSSTIALGGWTAVGAATAHQAVNESVRNDSTYAQSPNLTDPITFGIGPLSGSVSVKIVARRTMNQGQVRLNFLNAGSVSVGTTSWQVLTDTWTEYTLSASLTGTAVSARAELQP